MGISGIGDLIVTATSNHSRNKTLGISIGKGNPSSYQTVQIWRVYLFITERSNGIKSLLIRHDKQDVGMGHVGSLGKWASRQVGKCHGNLIRIYRI